jgi:hypothetical protein
MPGGEELGEMAVMPSRIVTRRATTAVKVQAVVIA